jgi:hypothetical protein
MPTEFPRKLRNYSKDSSHWMTTEEIAMKKIEDDKKLDLLLKSLTDKE